MNQTEFINEIQSKTINAFTKSQITEVLDAFTSTIRDEVLENNENVKLQGFGTFKPKNLKAREGVKPLEGRKDTYFVPARVSISFKPSKSNIIKK